MVIAIETLRMLRERNLPKDTVRVLWFIWETVEFGNVAVGAQNAVVAEACGVSTRRTCSCLAELVDAGFIRRGPRSSGVIYANPNHAFRGTAADQRRAVDAWGKGAALEIVARKRA